MLVSTLPVAVTGRGCAAVQISDADRRRKILLLLATDKCTLTLKKWRDEGESLRRSVQVRCRSLSIPNHDPQMRFCRTWRLGLGLIMIVPFFWKAYLQIENTLNGKRPRLVHGPRAGPS
jgi:hypothetical protein